MSVYIAINAKRPRIAGGGRDYSAGCGKLTVLARFSVAILILIAILTVSPIKLTSTADAAPGIAVPADSYLTLATTSNDTTLAVTPGTGFQLSTVGNTAAYYATTNNFNGYTITFITADDDKTLVNTDNSSYIINSIASPVEQSDFLPTDSTLINHWGIKPNMYYSGGTTIANTSTILPVPGDDGLILNVTDTANGSTAERYSIAIGAMADGTLPAGTYTRTATLTMIPNPIYYTITYDKNTTDTVTNLPLEDSGSATATKISISSLTPERAHYAFQGWCLGTVTTTSGTDTCSGTTFQPGDDFGIDQTTSNVSTLYAMWNINSYTVTYGTTTGIDSVTLNGGVACTTALSDGGCSKALTYGQTYDLVAAPSTGYSFTSWNAGTNGTIANTGATGATTTYTVGGGDSTITPTATINKYTDRKSVV